MYTLANMQESIKKVEATRAQRMANEPRRMTADEKDALIAAYHPVSYTHLTLPTILLV